MDMATPLGRERTCKLFLEKGEENLFEKLTTDDERNVQLAVLDKLKEFLGVVRITSPVENSLRKLALSQDWRVRHAVLVLLPKIAQVLREDSKEISYMEKFNELFGFKLWGEPLSKEELEKLGGAGDLENTDAWPYDRNTRIREDYLDVCVKIAKLISGDKEPRDVGNAGGDWLNERIVPVLLECDQNKDKKAKYHQRSVLLMGVVKLGGYLSVEKLEGDLVPRIVKMASLEKADIEKPPNLRLMVARELPNVAKHVSNQYLTQHIIPTLRILAEDEDKDVSTYANASLKAPICES